MRNAVISSVLALLLACMSFESVALADTFAGTESFEDGLVPAAWSASKGSLEVTGIRFKHGSQSLLWSWRKGGKFVVKDSAKLQKAATALGGGSSAADGYEPRFVAMKKEGGVKAWIYNERPTQGKLTFRFGSERDLRKDNPRYIFKYGLNFKGWRAMWVHFEEDAKNPDYKGDDIVSCMEVNPPADMEQGRLFLDIFEFTEYLSWKRTADNQFPTLNSRLNVQLDLEEYDKKNEVDNWNTIYQWSKLEPQITVPANVSPANADAFRTIEKRYEKWVYGSFPDLDLDYEPLKIRYDALQKFIESGVKKYDTLKIQKRDGVITGIGLFSTRSPHKPNFGKTVLRPIILPLVLDYKINASNESLEKAFLVFDYLNDQGWAAGSGMGTLNHQANQISGYVHAVYLLKDELKATGRLQREIDTIKWMTGFGEIYAPRFYKRVTADSMRTKYIYRLIAVMCMDDSPRKVVDMQYLSKWLTYAMQVAPGYADTIKPDHTGYHHRGAYGSAYAAQAYHVASLVAYILNNTPFAIAEQGVDNLKQALLAQRLYCNLYDCPATIGGRFPYNLSIINKMLPSYAYIALCGDPEDAEMVRVFKRLWRPDSDYLKKKLFTSASSTISYFDTLGSIEIMRKLAETDFEPEKMPQGHWFKPYAGLSIHRRGEWLATVKGWSQYIWDFEASSNQNLYGRYLSHGTIQIYSDGDPVGSVASGYDFNNGWDWNRWPGATTIHLPWVKLEVDKTCTQEYKEGRHRNFTDQTFMGGVSLEAKNGVFAMRLHDTAYERSFWADKTVFFCDNQIVCLGSGIRNNQAEYHTETTLFQVKVAADQNTVCFAGKDDVALPYSRQWSRPQRLWLTDPLGNGYVIRDARSVRLAVDSQESMHHSGSKKTKGDFATAWIDHGLSPDNEEYEFAILVKTDKDAVSKYAANPGYEVLQRDKSAHIVSFPKQGLTGYAIFDESKNIAHGIVRMVSAPLIMMTKMNADGYVLSLSDPDFRRPKMNNMALMPANVVYPDSQPAKVKIELHGKWNLSKSFENARISGYEGGNTIVEFNCRDAKTIEIQLKK